MTWAIPGPGTSTGFHLDRKELLKYDGWTARVKKFINSENSMSIDILEVVQSYGNNIIDFQRWFREKELEINKDALQTLKTKQAELFFLVLEDHIAGFYENKEKIVYGEQIFANLFTLTRFCQIWIRCAF
jgi:hypothetical protein